MTFQKRLKACMRKHNMRTANLARYFERPYTSVREWVLHGRAPSGTDREQAKLERLLRALEARRAG